ncbi:MAG: DsbA family protein [Magnetococcales bacterium]|nr:DsbA family protein [Magnetococcales bacterium]
MIKRTAILFLGLFLLAAPGQAEEKAAVASIGSWKVTLPEVDKSLAGKLQKIQEQLYTLRLEQIQVMVEDRLLTLEADAEGLSVDQLLEEKVTKKTPQVSEADVSAFIKKNSKRLPNKGKGMEKRVQEYLQEQQSEAALANYLMGLARKYDAKIDLTAPEPHRFHVRGPEDLAKGNPDAPITIIEFSDFECPYCQRVQPALEELSKQYGDKIRLIFRHYPLPFHKKAPKASEASQCAADQGAFWPYHDLLFENQKAMELENLKEHAKELKLDIEAFNNCLDQGIYSARVAKDMEEGQRLGVTGTPAFFINGLMVEGSQPKEIFQKMIDGELARLEKEAK